MRGSSLISSILGVILLVLAQVTLFKNMVLFDEAFCFAYVMIFLLIPVDTGSLIQLLIAFVVGLVIDTFYNTMGMHAAASVVFVFIKIYWIPIMTPSGGYDAGSRVNLRNQGLQWFLTLSYPLILIHSIVLLFIEFGGFDMFYFTLLKAFYSSLFTMLMVMIIQYLFYRKMN
ncbi:MAG: Rod shape-determining protein MreD [Reichenbachiella sp.]